MEGEIILILIKTDSVNLILECEAGIAGDVLYTISPFNPSHSTTVDGKGCFSVSMSHINKVNIALGKYKGKIKLDDSFVKWKKNNTGKTPLLIRVGVNHSRIYKSPHFEIPHTAIEDACKYFFAPAVRQKAFKDKKWDGYIHLYKKRNHIFLTGLLGKVVDVLKEKKIPYKIEHTYETRPKRQFDWKPTDLFQLSDDQIECIDECMKAGRCVVKAATGFGKR